MLVVIECAEIREDGKPYAQMYAYTSESADKGEVMVRDANFALAMVRSLVSGQDGGIREGRPPKGAKPIFATYIHVANVRGRTAAYRVAYKRFAFEGVYNAVAADQMEFYRDVKRAIREARGK